MGFARESRYTRSDSNHFKVLSDFDLENNELLN